MNCQGCSSSNIESIVFLGYMPPVNTMRDIGSDPHEENYYPLELVRCEDCGLAQIGYIVPQEILFPESYPYLSGTTRILRDNFKDQAKDVNEYISLGREDLVVDIGSNDGTLLSNYNCRVLGIEPSQAADVAISNGIATKKEYFNMQCGARVRIDHGPASVVTACNVFAHIDDVHDVIRGVKLMMRDDGIFVSESHYLPSLIKSLQYDTIYHEHLRYYHLRALVDLFRQHDLEVFHAKLIPTHGGSIRVFAAKKDKYPIDSSVPNILREESETVNGSEILVFRQRVIKSRLRLLSVLHELRSHTIYGIGAPSRASTLINYVGLDGILDAVVEVSGSHKLNKYIPGTRIPVLDEKALYEDQPPYALILSWHIADELITKIRENGYKGKFIIPLPNVRIVE